MLGHVAFGHKRYSPARAFQAMGQSRAKRHGAIRFRTILSDGVKLDGLYLPPKQQRDDRLPVLISHGWVEVKELYVWHALRLAANGHPVLLYDHRGHGRSSGDLVSFGIHERHDVSAVLDGAAERGWIGRRVIGFGHSMGGSTLIQSAVFEERLVGLLVSSPYSDLRTAIRSYHRSHCPFLSLEWGMRGIEDVARKRGIDIDRADTVRAARHVAAPALVLYAPKDFLLEPEHHAQPVIEAMPQEKVQSLAVPGANHFDLCQRRWPGLCDRIDGFLAEVSERACADGAVAAEPRGTQA
jgi:pimeloyl-ACP methyl ester carboxylesterase